VGQVGGNCHPTAETQYALAHACAALPVLHCCAAVFVSALLHQLSCAVLAVQAIVNWTVVFILTHVWGVVCRYAKFEMSVHEVGRARACYERALEEMGEDAHTVRRCSQAWMQLAR
jgi:hypothetical protein